MIPAMIPAATPTGTFPMIGPSAAPLAPMAVVIGGVKRTDPEPGLRFCFKPATSRKSGVALRRRFAAAVALLSLAAVFALPARAETVNLPATVEVDSAGITVATLVPELAAKPIGGLKLADAPEFGRSETLTRDAVAALLREKAPEFAVTNWTGAPAVKIGRKARTLTEDEVRQWLVATLQNEHVRDRGELELRITRSWKAVSVPDEALEFRLVDLPLSGIGPSFVARVAVECAGSRITTVQVPVQAKVWKEVLVAGSTLMRGQSLAGAEVRTERRDVLMTRDYVTPDQVAGGGHELVSNVTMGQLLTGRALRVKPAVTRGTVVDGLVTDGAMTISMKVEVLEDGAIGQNLRVRNVKTRREMLGKVQNEQTIVLYL